MLGLEAGALYENLQYHGTLTILDYTFVLAISILTWRKIYQLISLVQIPKVFAKDIEFTREINPKLFLGLDIKELLDLQECMYSTPIRKQVDLGMKRGLR